MSRFFDDLEAQLYTAARAQTAARRGAGRPKSRWLRTAAALPIFLAVGTAIAVAVVALTLIGHDHTTTSNAPGGGASPPHVSLGGPPSGPLGHPSPRQDRELSYINAAMAKVLPTPACQQGGPGASTISEGSPSERLLSILGVLRRPATPQDQLPARRAGRAYPPGVQNIYVHYIRLARVKNGVSYYIVPAGRVGVGERTSARCYAEQVAALRSELPRIPAALRASTLTLQTQLIAQRRRNEKQRPHEGICVETRSRAEGGGSCGDSASDIERRGTIQTDGPIVSGVVPDGVATVTFQYPASKGLSALTVATDVVGNVFAVSIARANGGHFPPTIIWRSAQGNIIKTISVSQQ
jgi:hypothetical protein